MSPLDWRLVGLAVTLQNMQMSNSFTFSEVSDHLKSQLDLIVDDLDDAVDEYTTLFNYFIGSKFEGVQPAQLRLCDTAGDQKIDFYLAEEDQFVVYQCKLGDFENHASVKSYGDSIINEAEDIYTFLSDETGAATGNKCAQEARNLFRQKRQSYEQFAGESGSADTRYRLRVCIAIFGLLSEGAKGRLAELRTKYASEADVLEVEVIDYESIRTELTLPFAKKERPSKINLVPFENIFGSTNNWGYTLSLASSFVELYEKYGMALFDLNVRYYLEKSSVNKQIKKTLNQTKGIDNFHLLNNGITIACTSWGKAEATIQKSLCLT